MRWRWLIFKISKFEHPLNIELILSINDILKLGIFNTFNSAQLSNILPIIVTLEVSKRDKSKDVNFLQL